MITNPKTFFEQFQNFIEESGLQLKKFKSNLSNYFTKAEAIDTFLGKTDKAESAITADSVPWEGVTGKPVLAVDEVLNATSLNPVANKTVYAALQEKITAEEIADAYLPLTGGTVTGGITAPNFQTGLGATNYFQCPRFRGEGDANTYFHAIDFGYGGHNSVDFYEYDAIWNFYRCESGEKSNAVLVGKINKNGWNGGARLTAASLEYEKYVSYVISGAASQPASSVMLYTATGAFTLNLSSISSKLATEEATVFTAYIKSNANYTLTITNAGTIKYIGSASDVAITSAGLLLNIMMLKDASGNLTSIVQASKLS